MRRDYVALLQRSGKGREHLQAEQVYLCATEREALAKLRALARANPGRLAQLRVKATGEVVGEHTAQYNDREREGYREEAGAA